MCTCGVLLVSLRGEHMGRVSYHSVLCTCGVLSIYLVMCTCGVLSVSLCDVHLWRAFSITLSCTHVACFQYHSVMCTCGVLLVSFCDVTHSQFRVIVSWLLRGQVFYLSFGGKKAEKNRWVGTHNK